MPLELTERTKADLLQLLQTALGGHVPNDQLRQSVEDLILDLTLKDRRELGEKIREALADNRVSEQELIGLLAFWVGKWPPSKFFANDFVKQLAGSLQDGELTTSEIGDLISEWLANRLPDGGPVQQLLIDAVLGRLDEESIANAVFTYLERIGRKDVADVLRAVMESDEPVTLPAVIQIIVAVLIRENRVPNPGITVSTRNQAVVKALGLLPADSDTLAILEAISQKQYGKAAALAFASVGVTADEGLLQALLTGGDVSAELRRIAIEKLTPWIASKLEGETPDQAKQVAELVLDIISGKKPLVAAKTEQEELAMGDELYKAFCQVRRVLYAAIMATKGGARVGSAAMAQPNVFAAAAITDSTKVKDLVSSDQRLLFLYFSYRFMVVEFNRPFHDTPFPPDSVEDGLTVRSVAISTF